jgi:hypothetical protein
VRRHLGRRTPIAAVRMTDFFDAVLRAWKPTRKKARPNSRLS